MRIAVMVKKLNEESDRFTYTLVLPPWGPLYHWQTRTLGEQSKIPGKQFFDVPSISRYVPALDFEDYVKRELFPIFYFEYFRNFLTPEHFSRGFYKPCFSNSTAHRKQVGLPT